jgi:hypothetical protein
MSKKSGLFARQRTKDNFKEIVSSASGCIKRNILLLSIVAVTMLSSCDKETSGQVARDTKKNRIATDSINKPKVSIKVNRHYDDKGNLVGFDSTYSSFYSNYSSISGDTIQMDSLMHGFDKYFNRNHSLFFDRQFDPLFFADSLRYPDFFHNDFFMKRYELNDQYMRESMKKMDSIKNQYFFDHSRKKKNPEDKKKNPKGL